MHSFGHLKDKSGRWGTILELGKELHLQRDAYRED